MNRNYKANTLPTLTFTFFFALKVPVIEGLLFVKFHTKKSITITCISNNSSFANKWLIMIYNHIVNSPIFVTFELQWDMQKLFWLYFSVCFFIRTFVNITLNSTSIVLLFNYRLKDWRWFTVTHWTTYVVRLLVLRVNSLMKENRNTQQMGKINWCRQPTDAEVWAHYILHLSKVKI